MNGNNGSAYYDETYFDSVGVEHNTKEIKKLIGIKNIVTNIYRIKAYNSKMCGYFFIGFIGFMLKGRSLLDYTNLLFSNEYENIDKIILKYFQQLKRFKQKKCIVLFVVSTENLKTLKYHTFSEKTSILSIICSRCENEDENI